MNTKTTLFLAFSFVVLVLLYYVVKSRPGVAESDTIPAPSFASSPTTRDLLEEKPGDVVKVVCRRKDDDEWVFEKEDAETSDSSLPGWRMTSPLDMKCVTWEVNKFATRLGNLTYELSYKSDEPGTVTPAEAGLDPPEATVTLTDVDDRTVTVEIGKTASPRETYVRLAGSNEICVGKSDLRDLIKDRAIEYRDHALWSFTPDDVTRIEIIDRSNVDVPVLYAFSKDGSRWMMELPVTARATSKVGELVSELSRMRAIKWQDDRPEQLATYGLDPAALTARVTVEEQIPAEEEDSEDEEEEEEEAQEPPAPEKKITVYELHLSDRSPIGEDTKTYMRIGDENAVATVMKSTADKFKPVMSEWREMRITTVNVSGATRIELANPEGEATLVKKEGQWSFEPDGGRAEDQAVADLLKAIGDLSAVVFLDQTPEDLASFGLDQPQAEIRLTIPGVEGLERIAVGGYTDEQTKRLVYLRRNDLASIAKVRRSDVAKLMEGPRVFRDRTIVDVLPSRFERITLSMSDGFADGGASKVTLGRTGNIWSLVEPVNAPAREDQVDKLVEALGGLHAEQVVAQDGEMSAYSLNTPAVTVTLTYKPPVGYRIEVPSGDEPGDAIDSGGERDETEPLVPVEVQPPSETLELLVTRHDGKYYVKRLDRPAIYLVAEDLYELLGEEYRTDRVLDFDDVEVRRLSIREGDQKHVFDRHKDRWTYEAEPDLPLDPKKVENLLLQIGDLRTQRYVSHVADDLARYGLSEARSEVTVTLEDGGSHVLLVSGEGPGNGITKSLYAAVKGRNGVFLLATDSVRRFEVSLDELEQQ